MNEKLAANMATSFHHHLLFCKSTLETAANLIELLKRTVAYLDLSTAITMIDFNLHAGNIGKQLFQRLRVGILSTGPGLTGLALASPRASACASAST